MINLKRKFIPTNEILKQISEIDEFKGQWNFLKNLSPVKLSTLKKVATIESIASSTRIEGSKLTDEEVEKLLSNLITTSFKTRDEQEVAGYAEVMDLVFLSFEEINITENYIKQLHSMLLKYSEKDERHRGDYKKINNSVEAFDPNGKSLGIVFETTSPFDTPYRMEILLEWLRKTLNNKDFHPIITIGMFIVEFLAIHPFQDGNGRSSRILTTLLLLKEGYLFVPYASIESIVEDNKDIYYASLRRTQKTLKEDLEVDYNPWINFFLNILMKQKNNLQKKLQNIQFDNYNNLPDLSVKILEAIKQKKKAKMVDILTFTNINRSTVKLHIRNLLKDNYIKSFGVGKGCWYEINDRTVES